jgi:LacI family transcriptional regulator
MLFIFRHTSQNQLPNPMSSISKISEIARLAGVGTATVDRTLNGRPGVNAETAKRVMEAVAALGNPALPGRPRTNQRFRFAYVFPDDERGLFDLAERQVLQAAGDFRHQRITELTYRFDAKDPNKFAHSLSKLTDCDGIALLAPDVPPVKLAINELARAGVHVVTLFSDVAGSMREAYVGADNRAAGRTAALLLARMAQVGTRDTILLSSQVTRFSAEIERRIGFAQALEERFPQIRLLRTPDLPASDESAAKAMKKFLKHTDLATIAGIYNVGCASSGVLKGLVQDGGTTSIGSVAHDLTQENHQLLIGGELSYLLHQDIYYCVTTAAKVLQALCENVRGALKVAQPRIEILTAENLE